LLLIKTEAAIITLSMSG